MADVPRALRTIADMAQVSQENLSALWRASREELIVAFLQAVEERHAERASRQVPTPAAAPPVPLCGKKPVAQAQPYNPPVAQSVLSNPARPQRPVAPRQGLGAPSPAAPQLKALRLSNIRLAAENRRLQRAAVVEDTVPLTDPDDQPEDGPPDGRDISRLVEETKADV